MTQILGFPATDYGNANNNSMDFLKVKASTAEGAYSMYSKQIGSHGCPHWERKPPQRLTRERVQELVAAGTAPTELIVVVSVFFGTDSGGPIAA